ncbi:hypothetical protein CSC2_09250 [Clostridium zeae]|uniref:Uncharacterized protein n=1 Tax=Clostridium zeae TaxID=2759022 RepID=A0ABQ1E6L5_9CLOT|nr:hypothetical protein [Clostridium zeae]GFZ30399.1 hypothetical protein CSC2_09250 [Clostridium zeae]
MLPLKDTAEIYRIGLVTGLFMKIDVIKWADKIIEYEENIEYEIIEISLMQNTKVEDIALKLYEINGIPNNQNVLNTFLGLCSYAYTKNKFTAHEICTILYKFVISKTHIPLASDIEQMIHYLSDGYYLASSGTYGNLNVICKDLKNFLNMYSEYAKRFIY